MSLRLAERWLWDFWFAGDGQDVHVFYLQAPRSLGDPGLRHHGATIGHARSRDLREWEVLPDALGAGAPGEWDDLATWTGSVLRHDGSWFLFYTGASRAEQGTVQRIGLATSGDLVTWHRRGLVLEADPRWYETRGPGAPDEHWRDPWVAVDEERGGWDMLVTARAKDGTSDARGVIGHARSSDLLTWTAGPPLAHPGELRQLEVPQLVRLGGRWRILFSAGPEAHGAARLARPGAVAEWGTHELVAESRLGPYRLPAGRFVVGDPVGRHYAGRLLEHDGGWVFMAWRLHDERGAFVGELGDPMPVRVGADGSLVVGAYT